MGQITAFLINLAGCIWTFANTTFATALIGSLAGAFAGAYGAQRIAERSKTKELLLTEIRNTNAAITVASVEKEGLLPDEKNYQNWMDGFVKK